MSYDRVLKLIYIIMGAGYNNFQPGSKMESSFCCWNPLLMAVLGEQTLGSLIFKCC